MEKKKQINILTYKIKKLEKRYQIKTGQQKHKQGQLQQVR